MEKNEPLSSVHLVQSHIFINMPHGGYSIVSQRLKGKSIELSNREIIREIRELKKGESNYDVLVECCAFLRENNVNLNSHCSKLLKQHNAKKER